MLACEGRWGVEDVAFALPAGSAFESIGAISTAVDVGDNRPTDCRSKFVEDGGVV